MRIRARVGVRVRVKARVRVRVGVGFPGVRVVTCGGQSCCASAGDRTSPHALKEHRPAGTLGSPHTLTDRVGAADRSGVGVGVKVRVRVAVGSPHTLRPRNPSSRCSPGRNGCSSGLWLKPGHGGDVGLGLGSGWLG